MATSSNTEYSPGTVVKGKWRNNRFVIQRILGSGANGTVYLVQKDGFRDNYALKMGNDTLELQSEINVLTALQTVRKQKDKEEGITHRPYLLEVDDYATQTRDIPFYLMRYVEGMPIHWFIQKRGNEWLGIVGLRLLDKLRDLHQSGFVFGDLKPENVMVSAYGEVELIDYGGVSTIGRSVKQFTEWYDRGYWNSGSRASDEGYDLFAFAVLCIHLLHKDALKAAATQHLPQTRSKSDLLSLVQRSHRLKPYASWLAMAIRGEFEGSTQARDLWKQQINKPAFQHQPTIKTPYWLRFAFTFSILLLCGVVYLALR
ncbi:protein kinase domain-containing protein [Paenibacillus crassostreae]|uniref:non-specific serine/threonine protein kinase n=1 Tax=Paenibacillus crassostreae TaxID=1763538 RepID=A0A167AMY4_9BACL|nr:serine/threonine protein kinase [Paenibacillus crassostreae]AOZ92803.1 serine/threonine protein kinase [Paenibacillus crassostreae]OAB71225.1 serine/threonine protein kinase [Paenibacillus crassostreae]